MSFVRTLPALIVKCDPESIDLRKPSDPIAAKGYEQYWRMALLSYARQQCGSVWVLGINNQNRKDWHASTSMVILRHMLAAVKVHGTSPSVSFVLIEPMGMNLHRLRSAAVAAALEAVDIPISFTDPNQQTIGF